MERPKVSLSTFEQQIDLEDLTGVDLSNYPLLMNEIAQATIDFIKERVDAGFGIGGTKLKGPYSEGYVNSLPFQAAGKSPNEINMQLTGDMLGSVDILEMRGSVFKYGLADEDQIPKAYNHQEGDTVPRRPWFGVTKDEFVDNILRKYEADIQRIRAETAEDELFAGAIQRAAIRIINEGDSVEEALGELFD